MYTCYTFVVVDWHTVHVIKISKYPIEPTNISNYPEEPVCACVSGVNQLNFKPRFISPIFQEKEPPLKLARQEMSLPSVSRIQLKPGKGVTSLIKFTSYGTYTYLHK